MISLKPLSDQNVEDTIVLSRLIDTDEYRECCIWIDVRERVVSALIDSDKYRESCNWIDTD